MERLSIKSIVHDLKYGTKVNGGIKGLFSEGKSEKKWDEIRESRFYRDIIKKIESEGEVYLKELLTVLPYSCYKIFSETGSRKEFEKIYFERRGRLNAFAILCLAYDDKRYLQGLEDYIWAICDEYSWCLPCHLDGGGNNIVENKLDGNIVKSYSRDHRENIDLFSAETAFTLCEIVNLLEEKISPMVSYRVKKEVKERILQPYCELNSMFWWEESDMNWAAVCAGGVGAAAMYLIEDDLMLAPIIQRVLGSMEMFLSGYKEDGVCTEGIGYWSYGFGFFVYFSELLKERTGGRIDLMDDEKVRNMALFQQKCYLSQDKVVSFSDSNTSSKFFMGLTHRLKDRYDEVKVPHISYRQNFGDDTCFRWAPQIRDLVWSNSQYVEASLETEAHYMDKSQWLISRYQNNENIISFAAKGGHNDEPHNHNDIGNFILNINGETLLVDLGAGEYTKQYFTEGRYDILCNSSKGHSVPIVNGDFQVAGREHKAEIIEAKLSEAEDIFVLDISKPYDNKNIKSLVRSFNFMKTTINKLVVKDEFIFTKKPNEVIERFMSFEKPMLLEQGKVRIYGDNNCIDIIYDHDKLEFTTETYDFINHDALNVLVYSYNFSLKELEYEVVIEIEFIPMRLD